MVTETFARMRRGFTLVELLIVMAIIATLLTIALPRYFGSVDKSKEVALKQSLAVMRDALDKYYADHAKYPDSLEELVEKRYLRGMPVDPITERNDTWTVVEVPPDANVKGEVYDVKSGAPGNASDGTPYAEL
ncbi:MAG: type II secretion system protein [Burkholderiales bacterium]|nr:type II secretion system protein [Burkholderiales bacterium]PZN02222.1 MAG: type II secretion system protein G [Pseudomonadota bacterium]